VLGLGFAASSSALEPLGELARAAEHAARKLGGPEERRAFRPHLTLARVRRPWPREAVERFRSEAEAWEFPEWAVRSCVLFQSRLSPHGATHTPLREWTLSGSPAGARA